MLVIPNKFKLNTRKKKYAGYLIKKKAYRKLVKIVKISAEPDEDDSDDIEGLGEDIEAEEEEP